MKLIVLTAVLLMTLSLSAQKSASYQEDFQLYKRAILETHPSLYRFTPKEKFLVVLDSVEQSINESTTDWEFYRALTRVHAMIRESHSFLGLSDQLLSKATKAKLFPFRVWMSENRILITEARESTYDSLVGKEVLSINGQSVGSLLQTLEIFSVLNSGYNNSAMYKELSGYDNFAYAYYFFINPADQFDLRYKTEGGTQLLQVNGSEKGLSGEFPKFPSECTPPYKLEIDEEQSTARLTITTFAYWVVSKKSEDYLAFFKDSFSQLAEKKIKNLIIDLSNNRGGEEMLGAELLTYLIDHDFKINSQVSTKTLDYTFTNSLPNSNKIKFPKKEYMQVDSVYVLRKGKILQTFEPKHSHHFDGNIYFITSGRSRSATNILLSLAKTHHVGTMVGQESGGTFQDLDGRWRVSFTLPYSQVLVSYPVWRFKIDSYGEDPLRGVKPDFVIDKTNEDILSGRNVELDFIYELINSSQ